MRVQEEMRELVQKNAATVEAQRKLEAELTEVSHTPPQLENVGIRV